MGGIEKQKSTSGSGSDSRGSSKASSLRPDLSHRAGLTAVAATTSHSATQPPTYVPHPPTTDADVDAGLLLLLPLLLLPMFLSYFFRIATLPQLLVQHPYLSSHPFFLAVFSISIRCAFFSLGRPSFFPIFSLPQEINFFLWIAASRSGTLQGLFVHFDPPFAKHNHFFPFFFADISPPPHWCCCCCCICCCIFAFRFCFLGFSFF